MASSEKLPQWMTELIEKGEPASTCLELFKEMMSAERADRAAEREMRKAEMEREVRLKELELREKELAQGGIKSGHTSNSLKTKRSKKRLTR